MEYRSLKDNFKYDRKNSENSINNQWISFDIQDARISHNDWWYDLNNEQKAGIERGLKDIDAGRVTHHNGVKLKYGL